jgi:hypothetical protein
MGSSGRALGLDNDRADLRNTENMISNRNASSGRAATAADEARAQRKARATMAQNFAQLGLGETPSTNTPLTRLGQSTPVVEPTNTSVAEYPVNTGSGGVEPPAGTLMRTPPVQPAAGTIPTYGGSGDNEIEGGSGEDPLEGGSAVERALQAFENGEPMTQEIMDTIQGAYDGTDQGTPFTPPNSAGPVTPSGSQVPDLTTITTPNQQAEIDQVIDEGTDDATGEPVSAEASNLMNTTVYDMIKDSGVDYTMEEVQSMMEWRQGQLAGMKTEEDANFQKQVDAEVFENVRNLGANGLQEITDRVNNHPDLSPREREAYLASIGKLDENFFSPSEGGARLLAAGEGSPQAQLAADMTATQDALDSFGMFSTGATAPGGGTSTDGGEGNVSPENLNALVSTEVSSAGQNPQGDDRLQTGPTMDIVQKLWQETGLDLGIIQSEIGNSTVSDDRWGRSDGIKVDEDLLRARLNRYIDDGGANPDGLAARQSAERLNQSQITELGLIQSQLDSNNADFSVLSRRQQTPEVQAAITKLRTSQQDLAAQATKLRATVGSVSSNRTEPGGEGDNSEDDEVIFDPGARTDRRFEVPSDAQTPNGNPYDPDASQFDRGVANTTRREEVREKLLNITSGLTAEGGGGMFGVIPFFDKIGENFRPRAEAESLSARRDIATETRNWFRSDAGRELFYNNPMLLKEAEADPVAFYQKLMENR